MVIQQTRKIKMNEFDSDEFYSWKDPINMVKLFLVGFIVLFVFLLFILPIMMNFEQVVDNVRNKNSERSAEFEWRSNTKHIVKTSLDCEVLQKVQLELIAKNANADSWLKSTNDESLKIAQEKYDLLC